MHSLEDGYDNISVGLMKLCTNPFAHRLTLICQNCLAAGTFAILWKIANIVLIHKKNDKQIASNYRPVYILLICNKHF